MACPMQEASLLDDGRVLAGVLGPTIAKGVIKRRPAVESLAQDHGLDTSALHLLQDLRRKYGDDPLLVNILFRSQVIILSPRDINQVLNETPCPFTSASKEKKSSLRHFEPGNILIADAEQREKLRPLHEQALATNSRIHPFASRFQQIIKEELHHLFANAGDQAEFDIGWDTFASAWSKITVRIVLGNAARNDTELIDTLDNIRKRANWGFMAFTDHSKLEHYQSLMGKYLITREQGSLVSRFPKETDQDLASQVAQWLFAFDAAALATYRGLALLGSHSDAQERAYEEVKMGGEDYVFTRGVFLESLRLWPTTPAILREATEDHQIAGKEIKKGTGVVIFTPFFHRDDENLEFAHQLEPEQWKDKEVIVEKGLVPFSSGPAVCPAHNLVPMVASLVMGGVVEAAGIELIEPQLDVKRLPGTLDNFGVKLNLVRREMNV